jgi:lysophospholipase L1-like esterase
MNKARYLLAFLMLLPCGVSLGDDPKQANSLQLTLPPEIYAVPGVETNIYFDNVVLTQTPEEYRFSVSSSLGKNSRQRWTFIPSEKDVGSHTLKITISDGEGEPLGIATTQLQVVPADAGQGCKVRLLIVGDSLTHASMYPNELFRLLSQLGNPETKMLGTHQPTRARLGVAHEGYGGWTWERFTTKYEPNPDGTYRKRSSPFVYLGEDQKPILDVTRYIREECDGVPPDVVIFMLGINDCFSAPAEDVAGIDKRIETMFTSAETLLKAIRKAAPDAEFGLCLTTPPNSRQSAFEANYKDRYPRWGWKRIQHRLVQRQIEHFGNQEAQRRFLIPTELNLDPVDGYPENNAVHPNESGYQQIGQSIYAWLKWRLSETAPSK